MGTLINECGIVFILSESGILAEGSIMGFIEGKFHNQCTRIHNNELLATVEQKMYQQFLKELSEDDFNTFQEVMSIMPVDSQRIDEHLQDPSHHTLLTTV